MGRRHGDLSDVPVCLEVSVKNMNEGSHLNDFMNQWRWARLSRISFLRSLWMSLRYTWHCRKLPF